MSPEFLPFTRPSIDEATIAGVAEVLRSGWITTGPQAKAFEAALSAHCGGRPVRALQLGHDHHGDRAAARRRRRRRRGHHHAAFLGGDRQRGPGSRRAAGVRRCRSEDAQHRSLARRNSDRRRRRSSRSISPDCRSTATSLYALAKSKNLRVIEDAAQAFGASWRGKPIGSFGDLVSFSFHANKNITTAEGGALVLPDEQLIPLAEKLRLQGITRSGEDGMDCDVLGGKANLTDIAARIGLGQLPRSE